MRLNPKVVGSLSGQGSAFDVSGIGMPLLVTGPLSGPSITPDLKNIMANPKQALEMFSSLGGIAGTLTGGTTDGSGLLNGVLGGDTGGKATDVVTGVIEQLGQQNGTEDGAGSNDLVGSLLQGVLKRAGPQEQPAATGGQAASLPGVPQTTEPTTRHDPADDIAAAGQYAAQVPPLDIVPIPTPNPRGAPVAAPAQQPEQPKSLIDQAVEQVLPPRQTEEGTTGGEGTETKSEDLIRNLLKQMGN
jgi:AsmA protein